MRIHAILIASMLLLAPTAPALAEPTPNVDVRGDRSWVKTDLNIGGQPQRSQAPSKFSDSVYELSPACVIGSLKESCEPVPCGDGDREYVQIEEDRAGTFKGFEVLCGLPDQSAQSLAVAEFYSTEVRVPAPRVHPGNGLTLVNFPCVYSTDFAGYEQGTDIASADVRLKFTPVSYIWNFGDGKTKTTSVPGEPYDAELTDHVWQMEEQYPVTHRYTDTGNFSSTVTIVFKGEFSVNGGGWQPISGSIQSTSPGSPLDVAEARGELILPRN
ncbi:MAG: PKD domain-containing protein [Mycobacteriales bacterium]